MCFRKLLLLVLFMFSVSANADSEPLKIVLHANDGFKLAHLENSVKNIRTELGKDVDIRIVINGKAVTRLLKSNVESKKIIDSILEEKVPIGLCHNAVSNNRVDKSMLIDGLEVLKTDGNVTVIKYIQQGYIYIKM